MISIHYISIKMKNAIIITVFYSWVHQYCNPVTPHLRDWDRRVATLKPAWVCFNFGGRWRQLESLTRWMSVGGDALMDMQPEDAAVTVIRELCCFFFKQKAIFPFLCCMHLIAWYCPISSRLWRCWGDWCICPRTERLQRQNADSVGNRQMLRMPFAELLGVWSL